MPRMYTIPFSAVAITAAQDLWEVKVGTNQAVELHGFTLSQTSDPASADAEILRLTIKRGSGTITSGSGGSTLTAANVPKTDQGDADTGLTVELNNTTRAVVGSGALQIMHEDAWQEISGAFNYLPTPEMRYWFGPADYIIVGLETAPADSITVSGVMYVKEYGG
jgi:hypothetical protein